MGTRDAFDEIKISVVSIGWEEYKGGGEKGELSRARHKEHGVQTQHNTIFVMTLPALNAII